MCVAVCVCEWVEAPGQAIRYWCSRLRVCRGKWMCVCVGLCLCVCVYRGSWCVAGERWPALIWSVICWSRCTTAASSHFLSLNFTVNLLFYFSFFLSPFLSLTCVSLFIHFSFTVLLSIHLFIFSGHYCSYNQQHFLSYPYFVLVLLPSPFFLPQFSVINCNTVWVLSCVSDLTLWFDSIDDHVCCLPVSLYTLQFFTPYVTQYCSPSVVYLSSRASVSLAIVFLFLSLKCQITYTHTQPETLRHNHTYITQ